MENYTRTPRLPGNLAGILTLLWQSRHTTFFSKIVLNTITSQKIRMTTFLPGLFVF